MWFPTGQDTRQAAGRGHTDDQTGLEIAKPAGIDTGGSASLNDAGLFHMPELRCLRAWG